MVLSRSFLFEDEYVDSVEVYEEGQWTRKVGWKLEPVRKKHCAVAIRYLQENDIVNTQINLTFEEGTWEVCFENLSVNFE